MSCMSTCIAGKAVYVYSRPVSMRSSMVRVHDMPISAHSSQSACKAAQSARKAWPGVSHTLCEPQFSFICNWRRPVVAIAGLLSGLVSYIFGESCLFPVHTQEHVFPWFFSDYSLFLQRLVCIQSGSVRMQRYRLPTIWLGFGHLLWTLGHILLS